MRSLLLGSLAVGLMSVLVACGDDTTATGGSGGSGGGQGGEGGSGNTTNNGGGGNGDGGGGGTVGCTAIESTDFGAPGNGLAGTTTPALGGADPDFVVPIWTGVGSGLPANLDLNACGDTVNCLLVFEDYDGQSPVRFYLATEGAMDITAVEGQFYASGSFSGHLEEIEIDDAGFATIVPNGECLDLGEVTFDIQPPTPGWTCDPGYYDETTAGAAEPGCDCNCGAVDPDCAVMANPVFGCLEGQTCDANAECAGIPTAWVDGDCLETDWDAGLANGCQCACGAPDPDCLLAGVAITGCAAGEGCGLDTCGAVTGWTCDVTYYDADDGCDCGCGAADPDCADATAASCEFCNDPGSCASSCDEINATNNATCD